MKVYKKNIYFADGCLFFLSFVFLFFGTVGLFFSSLSNSWDYKIETTELSKKKSKNDTSIPLKTTRYIQSKDDIETVRSKNPDAIVSKNEKSFPYVSTFFLIVALSMLVYSRFLRRHEKKVIRLWELLEKNKKVKVEVLCKTLGYDRQFILNSLQIINQNPGMSFSHNLENDMIVDDKNTVDWHLNIQCQNCAATVDLKTTLNIDSEFLTCPYCSARIEDPDFEKHKAEIKALYADQTDKLVTAFSGLKLKDENELRDINGESPIAQQISWRPLKKGGTSFFTRKFVRHSPYKVEFKPTVMGMIFSSTAAISILVLIVIFFRLPKNGNHMLEMSLFMVSAVVLYVFFFKLLSKPAFFDKQSGYFWKGKKSPRDVVNIREIKEYAKLEDVVALQLLSETCVTTSGTGSRRRVRNYESFELNLVLKDSSRINVCDHGNHKVAHANAQALSEFLEVPLICNSSDEF